MTGRQWPVHRTSSVDWSERHFQLRVENTWNNAAEIADALAVCQEETGADLLILVGDDRERRSMHERLPQAAAGPDRRGPRAAPAAGCWTTRWRDCGKTMCARARWEDLDRFLAARTPDGEGRAGAPEGDARAGRGGPGAPHRRVAGHPGRPRHPPRGVDRRGRRPAGGAPYAG
ncbi:hypothetical protein LV779_15185 [Streptomyces thinghirensis]|nr:hypothetical protein [Streptomyces thinghirensis]